MTAIKHDTGKPRMELLPCDALRAVAAVMTAGLSDREPCGAQKYADRNWEAGTELADGRMIGAALRHISAASEAALGRGSEYDATGHTHLAHAACCILMQLAYRLRGMTAPLPLEAEVVPVSTARKKRSRQQ